ncbi:MAG: hypothetical protein FD163_2515 [Hyphomonadaceae bacterium]|nr:MAG: hypothetical protein FD128_1589 [Hyphomonadaceae bacterium]KAF0182725.1 MAG: hypothetical protein FD163_2515 [Hyphomonadaceae bacterium]
MAPEKKKKVPILIGLLVAFAAFGASFYFSPYLTMNALKNAIVAGDSEKIETLVDFPAVRENVKGQLMAAMMKNMQSDPTMADNPFAGLATLMIPNLVTGMLDTYVTAEVVARLGPLPKTQSDPAPSKKEEKAEKLSKLKTNVKWLSMDRANIEITIADNDDYPIEYLKLKRTSLFGWQFIGLKLKEDIMNPAVQDYGVQ